MCSPCCPNVLPPSPSLLGHIWIPRFIWSPVFSPMWFSPMVPLAYFPVPNFLPRETWCATVHGVAKSQTWLGDRTTISCTSGLYGVLTHPLEPSTCWPQPRAMPAFLQLRLPCCFEGACLPTDWGLPPAEGPLAKGFLHMWVLLREILPFSEWEEKWYSREASVKPEDTAWVSEAWSILSQILTGTG